MKNIFSQLRADGNRSRIYGLDLLRAIAILFVMLMHGSLLLRFETREKIKWLWFDGVSLFFVLSGFLIGGIFIRLIQENKISRSLLAHFWTRRWFRTLPNYFLILVVLCILNLLFNPEFKIGETYSFFFFAQNLFYIHPAFFPEAWSLSVEEWFYLLLPVLVMFLVSFLKFPSGRALLTAILVGILFATWFRFHRYSHVEIKDVIERENLIRKQVFTQLDSMMYGVFGAWIRYHYNGFWIQHKRKFMFVGLLLFATVKIIELFFREAMPFNGLYHCVFSFSLTAVATLCLLPYLSQLKAPENPGVIYRATTYISLISYSMYLVNLSIVQFWMINKINWQPLSKLGFSDTGIICLQYSLFYLLTFLLSAFLYTYYEVPMTRLRDRKNVSSFFRTSRGVS